MDNSENNDDKFKRSNFLLKDRCTSKNKILNSGEEDEIEIFGYKYSKIRSLLSWACIIMTFGIFRLFLHWFPKFHLELRYEKCSLDCAEKLLIRDFYQGKPKSIYVENVITLNSETFGKMKKNKKNYNNLIPLEDNFDNDEFFLSVHFSGGLFQCVESIRMFKCKQLRYIWNDQIQSFQQLKGLDLMVPSSYLHSSKGLLRNQQLSRRLVYGSNAITVPNKGLLELFILEALDPFYCFQLASVALWLTYEYYFFAAFILAMSGTCIGLAIRQSKKNQDVLKRTVEASENALVILGNGTVQSTRIEDLVVGDVIEIPSSGRVMHCDAVLITGTCILDESILTGESVPVTKTSLPSKDDLIFNKKEHIRHTLFSGTKVVQTRGSSKVLAVVINTGNITLKGGLIRSILYPIPVDHKFEQESYNFIYLLGIIAGLGFFYTLFTKLFIQNASVLRAVFEALDLLTVAIPTSLPGTMTVGRIYAQNRLKQKDIYCISPRTINMSGSIDCVCFDKTGTLTEDGMDMWGVLPKSEHNHFCAAIRDTNYITLKPLLYGMVACHSIMIIDEELKGDPLDVKMFESTEFHLVELNEKDNCNKFSFIAEDWNNSNRIGIIQEFPFTSDLQRMSVITSRLDDVDESQEIIEVYCKGSPERINSICRPETIPSNFKHELDHYAKQGFRIIALAYKSLTNYNSNDKNNDDRDTYECDLDFQGFIIFENRIKPDTPDVITVLKNANIRTVMVTGDNLLTALTVAKTCGMITNDEKIISVDSKPSTNLNDKKSELIYKIESTIAIRKKSIFSKNENDNLLCKTTIDIPNDWNNYRFALTGNVWSVLQKDYPQLLSKFVTRGTVFARMSPDQKQSLILELQSLGYYVAMCGDGANDCSALKAAHTGISLSDAESSVASPFTSKNPTIACVPNVIREGRAALVTSFGIFKYMATYSLIFFASLLILYSIDSNFTDVQALYNDLALITVFSFYFGKIDSWDGPLAIQPPQNSLISLGPMTSIISQFSLAIIIQLIGFNLLKFESWYKPFKNTFDDNVYYIACVENYTIFVLSSFQLIILAFVYTKGKPYRKSILSNKLFTISLIINLLIMIYLTLYPVEYIRKLFLLILPIDMKFGLNLILLAIINFFISYFIEEVIIEYYLFKKMNNKLRKSSENCDKLYKKIENELRNDLKWPPV